jgi:hypothetical protein
VGVFAISFYMQEPSNDVIVALSAAVVLAAALSTVSIPLPRDWQVRRAIRLVLAMAPAIAVATWNPVARVAGHGTLYGLLGDDAPTRGTAARMVVLRGKKTLPHALLSSADLSGLDLSQAELDRTDLSMANLTGTNLSGAKLEGASLMLAQLQGADLSGTNLDRTAGIQSAHCDAATTLPSGWFCDGGYVHKGTAAPAPHPSAGP